LNSGKPLETFVVEQFQLLFFVHWK